MKLLSISFYIFLLTLTSGVCFAQEDEIPAPQTVDPKVRDKVNAARIGMITNRLGLTSEQAERFWPVYNEFIQKRVALRQEYRQLQQGVDPNNPDPKKQQELVNLGFKLKQNELNLEKDYSGKLMNIISVQQMLNLRKAEQDFRQLILNQLQQRRALQQRKENFRDKNQRLQPKKK